MGLQIIDELETCGPDRCPQMTLAEAQAYSRRLAKSHYENFTVVSWLMPAHLRDDFRQVYAFCRWADDLGDETGDREQSLKLLAWWRHELDLCYRGQPRHPVFVALEDTIKRHAIPRKPFEDLIDAFMQDQRITRYDTWPQVLDYCTRSANPVGRLVLYLCGIRDDYRQELSDATCTALQLANFWQDVRRDVIERDRVYIPEDVARKHGLDIDQMVRVIQIETQAEAGGDCQQRVCCTGEDLPSAGMMALREPYTKTIRELCERTWPLFEKGEQLLPLVPADVRVDIDLFGMGGQAILRMIRRQHYNTLQRRPSLGKGAKFMLLVKAVTGKLRAKIAPGKSPEPPPAADDRTAS